MTENEVFEGIHKDCIMLEICDYKKTGCGDCFIRQTLIKAEKALEEIQQYRAIGTVKEIKIKQAEFAVLSKRYLADLRELMEYQKIGTVEELKEDSRFLEFLYNHIQPNEMEQYLSMYQMKDKVAVNGYADQCGLMPAT